MTRCLRPGSARAAVAELVRLFPRGLFEDALPPIALRSQVYSLVPDRTAADRQLVRGGGAAEPSGAQSLSGPASPSAIRQAEVFLGQALRCPGVLQTYEKTLPQAAGSMYQVMVEERSSAEN